MPSNDQLQWCYEVLEIPMNASWGEIRRAYRELAQRHHPDRQVESSGASNDGERFKDISRAFRLLSEYVKEHGLPPEQEIHRQAPQPDPDLDTSKVYNEWRESFRHQEPPPASVNPVSVAKFKRYKRAALVILPVLIVYLVFGLGDNEDEYVLDSRWSEDVYTPPAVRTDIPSYVQVGLDKETVLLIQGEPTRKQGDVWYYGESKIFFEDGHVSGWEMDLAYPLRVDLGERKRRSVPRFTYGASKLEVEAIQGRPTAKKEDVWFYGLSKVYFRNGLVVRWENDPRTPLLVYE